MQESCNSSRPLCICSKNMTTDQLLRHMRQNLQLDHFELAYHSLEPEKGRRLCMTGICRQCGQRLCYGVELPEHEAPERLLAAIYHWCLHLWMVEGFRSAEDERDFRTVFSSLFHKEDQELAECQKRFHSLSQAAVITARILRVLAHRSTKRTTV